LKTLLNAKLEVQDIYTDAQIDQFIANEYTNISNTLTPLIDQKLNSSSYTPSQFATRADPTLTGNISLDGDIIRYLIETKLKRTDTLITSTNGDLMHFSVSGTTTSLKTMLNGKLGSDIFDSAISSVELLNSKLTGARMSSAIYFTKVRNLKHHLRK